MAAAAAPDVDVVRRFNRAWTQRVGALDESFLGTGLPLGCARLLHEIGPGGASVLHLRRRLGLDSGYLSRLLRRLEEAGLVTVGPDPHDLRRRSATLTRRGRATWNRLEERSEALARRMVEPLTERQRRRLDDALATAEALVRCATVELSVVDPASPGARSALASYVEELGVRFPRGFDPGPPDADDATLRPPGGLVLLAVGEGEPVASGSLRTLEPGTGELKRMWVHADWRGGGLGGRLLRELEARAAGLGHARLRLDTNGTLGEAVAMYRRSGYREVPRYNDNPYADHWFEKDLTALQ